MAELLAKVGPVVLRNRAMFMRTELTPPKRPEDTFYHAPIYDLLMPTSGWSLSNSADLLVMLMNERLILGVRHTLRQAYHGDENSDVSQQRVGPLVAYKLARNPGARYDAPTVVALVQWHTEHRYRASSAMPYVLLAFAFQGDLLSEFSR